MHRRAFLKAAFAGAAGIMASDLAAAQAQKPNIIVIMADDLGWGDLGCYGHPVIRTPNIDKLAQEGTLYTHFYCNASICSPTRAAMMTGRFPGRVGVHSQISTRERMESINSAFYLDTRYPMLPRMLQEAGYHTMHIGKWHLSEWLHQNPDQPRPSEYGFDDYLLPYLNWPKTKYGDKWQQKTHRPYATELFVDQGIKYLQSRKNSDNPFFLQVWLVDPHDPLIPKVEQMQHYNHMKPGQPYNEGDDKYLEPNRIWYSVITEMDRQLGRLFDAVDRLGMAEDTYVIFTSDNGAGNPQAYDTYIGWGSNGPFRGQKGSLYEGGLRTPFIVRCPGRVAAGRVDDKSVISGVDFMPTFSSLAGYKEKAAYTQDGEDVSDALGGKTFQRNKPLMWQWRYGQARGAIHQSPMLAIREGRWKLLANPDKSRIELYDVAADPSELDNKADANPELVRQLFKKLIEYHNSLPDAAEGPYDKNAGKNTYAWPKEK
jgi:arylsulfatase A-like enzyme